MFLISILLTLSVLAGSLFVSQRRTRDALHPLIFLAPLLAFVYVVRPFSYYLDGNIEYFFKSTTQLMEAQFAQLLGLLCFCAGVLRGTPRLPIAARTLTPELGVESRKRLTTLAIALSGMAAVGFLTSIQNAGGFDAAYSVAKGGGYAASGYLRELPHLSITAIAVIFRLRERERFTLGQWALLLISSAPFAIAGTLGSRRGPLFMLLSALFFSSAVFSPRSISLKKTLAAVGTIGLAVLFIFTNRSVLHLNSDFNFELGALADTLVTGETSSRDAIDSSKVWLISTATIASSQNNGVHYWGTRWATILFVRPIPRQVWPSKYEDVGFEWLESESGFMGISAHQWYGSVGWLPPRGSAISFVADTFLEIWYLHTIVLYGIGRMFSTIWLRSRTRAGAWSVLYIITSSISIFLATQTIEAFFFRLLFVSATSGALAALIGVPLTDRSTATSTPLRRTSS